MSKFRRITVIIVTALIALAMLSSAAFVAAEADHDCTGEGCEICCAISLCVNIFKSITATFTAAAALAFALYGIISAIGSFKLLTATETPVSLKTKLLN